MSRPRTAFASTPSRLARRAASTCGAFLSLALLAACSGQGGEESAGTRDDSAASALASDAWAWGFAWVSPSSPISAGYSFNSTSGANSYTGSAGDYTVRMEGLGVGGGTVQVVAYGGTPTRCKAGGWGPSGSAMSIRVLCHDPSGALAASPFVVFFNKGASQQTGAYAYYSGSSVPDPWSWNSAGGVNSVTPTSPGYYAVTFPGIHLANASVHVTAYGGGAEYCKIVGWGSLFPSSGTSVTVRCNDTNGNPASSPFVVNYSPGTPRSSMIGGHAWVDSATTASPGYQSVQNTISCFSAGPVTVASFSDVTYPDTFYGPMSTMTLSTAYGDDGSYCKVRNWYPSSTGYTAHTSCFTASGAPTTTRFTSSFMGGSYPGPC